MQISDLRVALFSGNYNYVRDGANQALNRLVGYLEKQGAAVRVYSPTSRTPAFPPTGTLISVPSIAFPGRGEYRVALGIPRSVRADIAAFKPTLFHLSAPDILGHRAQALARVMDVPCVASVHTRFDTYFRYYKLGWVATTVEAIMRRFYRRCAEIYAPSESMAHVLREQRMSHNVGIWSRGVDSDLFRPDRRDMDWRRSLGIGDDEVVVAFVARLVREKGLDTLAETFNRLRARGVPHRALIVGEGPARPWLEEQMPQAIYTGFQSGEALARAYASADLLFNPSSTETFGNVTLEAMASGLAVVAARATGSLCLVEDGQSGMLVTPDAVEESADALARYILDGEARRDAGARGFANSRHFSWDEINQQLVDRYLGVLAAHRSRTGLHRPTLRPKADARGVGLRDTSY